MHQNTGLRKSETSLLIRYWFALIAIENSAGLGSEALRALLLLTKLEPMKLWQGPASRAPWTSHLGVLPVLGIVPGPRKGTPLLLCSRTTEPAQWTLFHDWETFLVSATLNFYRRPPALHKHQSPASWCLKHRESVTYLNQVRENKRKIELWLKTASCHQTQECVCQELRGWSCNIFLNL